MIDQIIRQKLRNDLATMALDITNLSLNSKMFQSAENMVDTQSKINQRLDQFIDEVFIPYGKQTTGVQNEHPQG